MTAEISNFGTRPRQNWVLSARADFALIIAAPILWFLWAAAFNIAFGPEVVFTIFMGFNFGHHMPTFIRIYGDKDLLRRFRFSLLLGPILPFCAALGVSAYVIQNDLPFNNVMFLVLILVIWDPWHFLMQHFGFMRIYDKNNRAPRKLAGRMDLAISAAWFIHFMIAAISWLPDLLYTLYSYHVLPLARFFAGDRYALLEQATFAFALVMTVIYIGYLLWCRRRGFYLSPAKLLLLSITLGVIYLTYVPNALIERFIPSWSFSLGFAALGMVHVTQYLAIVWKYNRGLASRPNHSRSEFFRKFFSRGGFLIGATYTIFCLLYGYILTVTGSEENLSIAESIVDIPRSKWFFALLFSIGFTSTLMHYYYDGFIWKIRHNENQKNLDIHSQQPTPATADDSIEVSQQEQSWWDASTPQNAGVVLFRQACYFLIPILILAGTYWVHTSAGSGSQPLDSINRVNSLEQARESLTAIRRQIEIEEVMIQIRPRAQHYTYLAELTVADAIVQHQVDDAVLGMDEKHNRELRDQVKQAIRFMETGLNLPAPYANPERPDWQRDQFEETLSRWKSFVAGDSVTLPGSRPAIESGR